MKKTVWLLALSVLVIVVGAVAIWGLQTHSSKSTTEVTSVKDKKQSKKTRSAKEPTKKLVQDRQLQLNQTVSFLPATSQPQQLQDRLLILLQTVLVQ